MPITGRTACLISTAGIGMAFGAVSSGISGGTMTAPMMLAGGAFGYLLGTAVCRIPALERAFDRALETDKWDAVFSAVSDPAIKKQAVAAIHDDVGVEVARAEQLWDALVDMLKTNPRVIVNDPAFKQAAYHPPVGTSKHGLAILQSSPEA